MEENISWLQDHPGLSDADAGQPGDQFDANRAWKMLREVLYMDYWRRAWVVQELVLAQNLLFFAEAKVLDADALFATLRWFQKTKRLAKEQQATRPAWLIPSVWNFLTYDNLMGCKSLVRIHTSRTGDAGAGSTGCSCPAPATTPARRTRETSSTAPWR